jgi:hypothetical protein
VSGGGWRSALAQRMCVDAGPPVRRAVVSTRCVAAPRLQRMDSSARAPLVGAATGVGFRSSSGGRQRPQAPACWPPAASLLLAASGPTGNGRASELAAAAHVQGRRARGALGRDAGASASASRPATSPSAKGGQRAARCPARRRRERAALDDAGGWEGAPRRAVPRGQLLQVGPNDERAVLPDGARRRRGRPRRQRQPLAPAGVAPRARRGGGRCAAEGASGSDRSAHLRATSWGSSRA